MFHSRGAAESNIVMVYLLGVAGIAAWAGRWPAVFCSVLSVLSFDFFFVPPTFSFSVTDVQYLFTFGVMLSVGLLIANQTSRFRERLLSSQALERRSSDLFRLAHQLSEVAGESFLVPTAGRQLQELFPGDVVLYLRNPAGKTVPRFNAKSPLATLEINSLTADWVATRGQPAGLGTDTLPNAEAYFSPDSTASGDPTPGNSWKLADA
jgi:two-component system sensor histidine kinase KdpD